MSTRDARIILSAALIGIGLAVLANGCNKNLTMRPGRDAYYQVTTQLVPAQASGSHSQHATLSTSGSVGSVDPTGPTT